MPERAVCSPTAVMRTRRLPPLATVPAMTLPPGLLRDGAGLAGDHRLVNIGRPLDDCAIGGNSCSGANENNVSYMQSGEWNDLDLVPSLVCGDAFGGVREQGGECVERATSLRDGSHFQPVAEDHDRNQSCQFPPDFNFEETEGCGERRSEGDDDGEADESHHAGLAVGKLAPCSAEEHEPAINEDDRSEDGGDEFRARERRCGVSKPVLDVGRPEDCGNGEGEAQPEFVAKHGDGVAGVAVVVSVAHVVVGVQVRCLSVAFVGHLVHLKLPKSRRTRGAGFVVILQKVCWKKQVFQFRCACDPAGTR